MITSTRRMAMLIALANILVLACAPCMAEVERALSAPALPIEAKAASRNVDTGKNPDRAAQAATNEAPAASSRKITLRLSAGLSTISIPVQTEVRKLSALMPKLPRGARAWTWNASAQQWVEGLDQDLPLGAGVLLYLPSRTVLTFDGLATSSSRIPVELANGWNLIGVPYLAPLILDAQSVWGGGIESRFNDATARGLVSERVFTLDAGGNKAVRADATLEPTRAYWVYANGADMLALRPVLLRDAAKEFAWWTAKQAGAAGFSYGAGQLIAMISPDPNQPMLDKLGAITQQLEDVQRTQQKILDQFALTSRQIRLSETEILSALGEVAVNNVRSDVAAHFDDANNQNQSFMYFARQATTPEGRQMVTAANKVEFANNVLKTWNFVKQFNDVQEAIAPSANTLGLLDRFADKIVLSGGTNSTLEDRYRAMEAYFNGLIGLQVKIMTLLTNSWDTLAQVPNSGYSSGFADQWRADVYTKALTKEAQRFRDAAERVMAGSLRVSSELGEAPVSVPPVVYNTIAPSVDFGVMQLANEAPGVRVRVFAGRHLNEPDPYTIVDDAGRTLLGLPSSDSGLWKTLAGSPNQFYDAWRVRGNPATFDSKSAVWEFYRDNNWIMYRTTLALPPGPYKARMTDAWKVTDDDDTPGLYGLRAFQAGNVDEQNKPASNGKLFGSLVLAKRAAARTALRVYNDGASSYWDYCKPNGAARPGKENDYFSIGGNCYGGGWAGYQRLVPFYFMGPDATAAGNWQMAMTTRIGGGCTVNESTCMSAYSLGQIELLDNEASFAKLVRFDNDSAATNYPSIRWDTSHAYKLNLRLVHTGTSNGVGSEVKRGGLVIRFNPTP